MSDDTPKLHKVLAQSGLGSRLEMERLISEGRITVNDELAHVGQRIQFGDRIKVNGRSLPVRIQAMPVRVLAYHKPVGEIAHEVGYESASRFATRFRARFGVSPTTIRTAD